ncbi:MAG: hypothetical protein ACPIOQ_57545, partial [Promethearchaeia archaeon]
VKFHCAYLNKIPAWSGYTQMHIPKTTCLPSSHGVSTCACDWETWERWGMRVAMRLGKVGTAGKAADARCVESQEPQMKKYVHASRPQSTETPVN